MHVSAAKLLLIAQLHLQDSPLSVNLHLRHKRTDGRTETQGSPSIGGTNRDASYKFKGEIKIRNQPINTQN